MVSVTLVSYIAWSLFLFTTFASSLVLDRFATSKLYENTKLVLELENPFQPQNITKEKSFIWARMECARLCSLQLACHSFNFYETGAFYVCQLLVDSFCARSGRLALQAWPGGLVWDKLSPNMTESCIEQRFQGISTSESCEAVSPGCRGIWPACIDCVQSCYDCRRNRSYSSGGGYDCTLWPQGHSVIPIFGKCFDTGTYIIKRRVNALTGNMEEFYLMSFSDMNRLSNLNAYRTIEFWFEFAVGGGAINAYGISGIDSSGKLKDVYFKNGNDGLNLNGATASFDFGEVSPDKYNCGSFWLLDPNNATFCPGGRVSMFGTPKFNATGHLVSTGIRWTYGAAQVIQYADVKLAL